MMRLIPLTGTATRQRQLHIPQLTDEARTPQGDYNLDFSVVMAQFLDEVRTPHEDCNVRGTNLDAQHVPMRLVPLTGTTTFFFITSSSDNH